MKDGGECQKEVAYRLAEYELEVERQVNKPIKSVLKVCVCVCMFVCVCACVFVCVGVWCVCVCVCVWVGGCQGGVYVVTTLDCVLTYVQLTFLLTCRL